MRAKRLLFGLVAAALAVSLAACGASTSSEPVGQTDYTEVINTDSENTLLGLGQTELFWRTLPNDGIYDGGRVLCQWVDGNRAGGLSCDWLGYHLAQGNLAEVLELLNASAS